MLLTEGFLGWLSRFKLIRLRRISLATLPRYGRRGGRRDGKTKGFIEPKGSRRDFEGGFFWDQFNTD